MFKFLKNNIQKIFIGVLIIIVLGFVLIRGEQLDELIQTMKNGSPIPLVVAILSQLCKYFVQGCAYSQSFKAVGETMKIRNTIPLVFGTFFLNTIAPSMNLAGTTLVVDDARRRGIDPGKSTSAALLMQITIDGAFTTVMIIAFTILLCTVGLNPLWIIMGCVVVCLVLTMISILVIGKRNPALLDKILCKIEKLVNKIIEKFHHKPLKPWAKRIVENFSEASNLVSQNMKNVLAAYGFSLIASICELTCFALVGVSFEIFVPEPLICGYVVATLFAMISITPQGVGVVEAMVVVAFTAYNQNGAAAAATGLVYRGIVFWMPFIIGAVLMTQLKAFKGSTKKSVGEVIETQETIKESIEEEGELKSFIELENFKNSKKVESSDSQTHNKDKKL